MLVALANARTLGTASPNGRSCGAPSISGSSCVKSGAFASRRHSTTFYTPADSSKMAPRFYTCPACKSKLSEDDDGLEGAETETKDNPELKLLIDLIVEYPATRGTLAVLFG